VMVNMVTSADGATAVDGVTRALGSRADRAIFVRLRDVADGILVGASTVRAERYGPARPSPEAQRQRLERGQTRRPPIVVASRSMDFDWDTPFFADADPPPHLLAPEDTDPATLDRARRAATVTTSGQATVDLAAALASLRAGGIDILLCEGGPTLNAELIDTGLVDELCLTVAPVYVGGGGHRGVFAPTRRAAGVLFRPLHVLEEDGFLYCRYQVFGTSGTVSLSPGPTVR
ncbi:MAG: dihydrofolate reductase family protein, partial [Actinomycetes bacterium]